MSSVPLSDVLHMVEDAVDLERIELGRRRQEAVWRGESPDFAPLLLGHSEKFLPPLKHDRTWKLAEHRLAGGAYVKEIHDYPHYSPVEQFDSPEKMLYEALWDILSWARSGSDAQLAIRANYVQVLPSIFNVPLKVNEEGGVWQTKRLTMDEALSAEIDPVEERGLIPRALDTIAFYKEHLPEGVRVYCSDTSSPLTLAEGLLGTGMWTAFYDSPDRIRRLLDRCADVCIKVARAYKKAIGETLESGYHGSLYMAKGSVRIVDDNIVMLSPQMWREFVLEPTRRVFDSFGGGWFHSCGTYEDHLDQLLAVDAYTAINLGNPELWDMGDFLRRVKRAGKLYYGLWPRRAGEPFEDYLRRAACAIGPDRRGAILMLDGSNHFLPPAEIMDLWHTLQDDVSRAGRNRTKRRDRPRGTPRRVNLNPLSEGG